MQKERQCDQHEHEQVHVASHPKCIDKEHQVRDAGSAQETAIIFPAEQDIRQPCPTEEDRDANHVVQHHRLCEKGREENDDGHTVPQWGALRVSQHLKADYRNGQEQQP